MGRSWMRSLLRYPLPNHSHPRESVGEGHQEVVPVAEAVLVGAVGVVLNLLEVMGMAMEVTPMQGIPGEVMVMMGMAVGMMEVIIVVVGAIGEGHPCVEVGAAPGVVQEVAVILDVVVGVAEVAQAGRVVVGVAVVVVVVVVVALGAVEGPCPIRGSSTMVTMPAPTPRQSVSTSSTASRSSMILNRAGVTNQSTNSHCIKAKTTAHTTTAAPTKRANGIQTATSSPKGSTLFPQPSVHPLHVTPGFLFILIADAFCHLDLMAACEIPMLFGERHGILRQTQIPMTAVQL